MTPNLSEIGPGDFQFINMSRRQASVPHCKRKGFEWNGWAVKELAGPGAVYIRLTKAPAKLNISDDDDGVDLSSKETLLETPVTPSSCPATLVGTSDASAANFTSVATSDVSAFVSRNLSAALVATSDVSAANFTSVATSDDSASVSRILSPLLLALVALLQVFLVSLLLALVIFL